MSILDAFFALIAVTFGSLAGVAYLTFKAEARKQKEYDLMAKSLKQYWRQR